ncbi:cell division protein BlhA [Acinetobacter shaoyimingii]|uniref:Uncharacterized protein n=1 Tax=Acinetobacter shaoyimingii TaxID=2715164 RepID=A0A6G8RZ67_9GAMM|nr:hypothetical protein [Acinetobacter shaoyimingii]QIO07140.1 hypothetical protein G8E00_14965 [Acinetobacter shaoyimingii]
MALNVGQNFKQRWLSAPEAVRQAFLDDLNRVSELLQPESNIQQWLENDQRAMQIAQLKVEEAYAEEKARLIEAARVRKQLALEKSLAEKRHLEQVKTQQLLQDEVQQYQHQTEKLQHLRHDIDAEIAEYSQRYSKNPDQPAVDYSRGHFLVTDTEIHTELDSIRLRLELEAETQIEEAVTAFRNKLIQSAKEEIDYILKNSDLVASTK